MLRSGLLLLCAVVLVGSTSTRVATQGSGDPHEIVGLYYCNGTDAAGNPYEGVVRIAERGHTVLVQWSFGSEVAGIGFGVLNGDTLAVSYLGPSPGVALYRREGGRLVGTWTEPAADGAVFPETLTPVPEGELVPLPPGPETGQESPSRPKPEPETPAGIQFGIAA